MEEKFPEISPASVLVSYVDPIIDHRSLTINDCRFRLAARIAGSQTSKNFDCFEI